MLGRIGEAVRHVLGFPLAPPWRGFNFSFAAPGSRVDWAAKAGMVYDNAIVSIAVGWIGKAWSEATLYACQIDQDGGERRYPHPLVDAVADPNPWYTGDDLWAATVLSLCVDGNAYWAVLRRDGSPLPAFVYLPHWRVTAEQGEGGRMDAGYEYRAPDGQTIHLAHDAVVHFRQGLDPKDVRRGLSPLAGLIREVAQDNMAATYSAALLNRMGVPGMVFSPAADAGRLTNEQRELLKASVQQVFTLDGAGTVLVIPTPGKVEFPKSGPQQLALASLAKVPADRILAALGLSGMALNLASTHQTFNNYETALESAWEHGVLPLQAVAARTLQRFGRRLYSEPDLSLRWDYRSVRALQPDMDAQAARWAMLFKSDLVTRGDARAQLGLEVDDVRDDVFYSEALAGVRGEGAAVFRAAGALARVRRESESGPEATP